MPKVHTTKEYEKSRDELLTRGKIGKDVYCMARVAEAEAHQGRISSISTTHHGEKRIPDSEKYDLPGDYRLIIQRLDGADSGRVFRFVGKHDDAEQWLDNHRGARWKPHTRRPNPSAPAGELERQRLTRELHDLKSLLDAFEQDNDKLNRDVADRDKALAAANSQLTLLEGKQNRLQADREYLIKQHTTLLATQRDELATKERSADAVGRRVEDELAAKSVELEENARRLAENRDQLTKQREEFVAVQQQINAEKSLLLTDLHNRTTQIAHLAARLAQLEDENRELRAARVWTKSWFRISAVALGVFFSIVLFRGTTERPKPGPIPPHDQPSRPNPPSSTKHSGVKPDLPIAPEAKSKTEPLAKSAKQEPVPEEKTSGPTATEPQMRYLHVLVRRRKWTDDERDAVIKSVLGYSRAYARLTKREASKLIDAWKESK